MSLKPPLPTIPHPRDAPQWFGGQLWANLLLSWQWENQPLEAARVYASANQSIPTGVLTVINFDLEEYDIGGAHSTTVNNSRLTARTNGLYLIHGMIFWDVNAVGVRAVQIFKNGTTPYNGTQVANSGGATLVETTSQLVLVAGDYVELRGQQTSGGNLLSVNSGVGGGTSFSIVRLYAY